MNTKIKIKDGTKYRPANGTEAIDFMERFCFYCKEDAKFRETEDGEDGCPIILKTQIFYINDAKYPEEWIYKNNKPICTAFEKE